MDEEGTIASGRTTPSASDPPSAAVDSPAIKLKDDPVKRAKVIIEIVETEKSYLKGLQELCDIYIVNGSQPVNSSSGRKDTVLPAAERRAVFGNVVSHAERDLLDVELTRQTLQEAIRDFHEKIFLPDLLEAAQTSPSKLPSVDASAIACDVADVFVRHAAFLKWAVPLATHNPEADPSPLHLQNLRQLRHQLRCCTRSDPVVVPRLLSPDYCIQRDFPSARLKWRQSFGV